MGEGTYYEVFREKAESEPGIFPKVNRQPPNKLLARMNAGIESFVGFLLSATLYKIGGGIYSVISLFGVLLPIAAEWDYQRNGELTPDKVMPFSNRKVWWQCAMGHHWQCSVQIRQKGTGCPYCA